MRFLIDTVWNDGIRSFAVDVLEALGLNDIAKGYLGYRCRLLTVAFYLGTRRVVTCTSSIHLLVEGLRSPGVRRSCVTEFTRAVGGPARCRSPEQHGS